MFSTIVLLSAMVLGQCGPRGCPAPRFESARFAPPTFAPSAMQDFTPMAAPVSYAPLVRPETDRPYFIIQTHRIKHEGLSFDVKGYVRPNDGRISWEMDDPRNQASYDAAKQAASLTKTVRHDRVPSAEPAAVVPLTVKQIGDVQNFGLAPDKMRANSTYTTTGEKARQFVLEAKAPGGEVPKLHVTVIGSDDARAPVVNDLMTHPELAALKPHLMVQDYKPGEWEVDESLGFQTNGKPTIIVQSAKGPGDPRGGRVIFRANDYESGPKGLAEAIRKADPHYKPAIDPGPLAPAGPNACPLGFDHSHWPYLLGAAAAVFILFKLPRKEG